MDATTDDFSGLRVLVADDNEIEREVVVGLVESLGAACTVVADGDALAEKLLGPAAGDFDFVLTDEHMPGRNGLDVCAGYRNSARANAATLPFVGMSADTDPALYDRAVAVGMNAMMLKPLRKSVLAAHFTILLRDDRANAAFIARVREVHRALERAKDVAVEDARFLGEVMNAFPMPCLVWNENGEMLRCNAAYGRLMKRAIKEFDGLTLKDLFGDGAEAVNRFHRMCLAKNEISVTDERFSFDLERGRTFVRHAMPITTEKGQRVLLCVMEDVTDSRQRESLIARQAEVLREERDHAVAAEKAKSYFFSTVSHDIRTPLNAIIGYSQLLKLGVDDEAERKRAIDSIITSGNVLLQLINDVLDLSKLEAGKMEINLQPTDCGKLVNGVVDAFRAASASRSVVPSARVAPMPFLQVDEQRVRQILFNLVGNAMKFTEKGEVVVTASFSVPPEEEAKRTRAYGCAGTLELEVRDTGCGISEEDQERIAQPYVQVGSRVSRNGGTGLGLAIVKQLVFRMDGDVELRSQPGVGTTFRIFIPAVEVPADVHLKSVSVTQKLKAVVAPGANANARILVVDDSSVNRMVLRSMLGRLGYANVDLAANGAEALEAIRREKPTGMRGLRWAQTAFDLVLTDMWMPEMDGEAFVRAVRSDPTLVRLPVYAVTADVEAQQNYAAMGFTGILLKPVTLESLRNLLVT